MIKFDYNGNIQIMGSKEEITAEFVNEELNKELNNAD